MQERGMAEVIDLTLSDDENSHGKIPSKHNVVSNLHPSGNGQHQPPPLALLPKSENQASSLNSAAVMLSHEKTISDRSYVRSSIQNNESFSSRQISTPNGTGRAPQHSSMGHGHPAPSYSQRPAQNGTTTSFSLSKYVYYVPGAQQAPFDNPLLERKRKRPSESSPQAPRLFRTPPKIGLRENATKSFVPLSTRIPRKSPPSIQTAPFAAPSAVEDTAAGSATPPSTRIVGENVPSVLEAHSAATLAVEDTAAGSATLLNTTIVRGNVSSVPEAPSAATSAVGDTAAGNATTPSTRVVGENVPLIQEALPSAPVAIANIVTTSTSSQLHLPPSSSASRLDTALNKGQPDEITDRKAACGKPKHFARRSTPLFSSKPISNPTNGLGKNPLMGNDGSRDDRCLSSPRTQLKGLDEIHETRQKLGEMAFEMVQDFKCKHMHIPGVTISQETCRKANTAIEIWIDKRLEGYAKVHKAAIAKPPKPKFTTAMSKVEKFIRVEIDAICNQSFRETGGRDSAASGNEVLSQSSQRSTPCSTSSREMLSNHSTGSASSTLLKPLDSQPTSVNHDDQRSYVVKPSTFISGPAKLKLRVTGRRDDTGTEQARPRPSRTAGKSALSLISSQFDDPYACLREDTCDTEEPVAGKRKSALNLYNERMGPTEAPSNKLHARSKKRPLLQSRKKPYLTEELQSLVASALLQNFGAGSESMLDSSPQLVLQEGVQRKLLRVSKLPLPVNALGKWSNKEASSKPSISEMQISHNIKTYQMLESTIRDPNDRPAQHPASLLRHREHGFRSHGQSIYNSWHLRSKLAENIRPWRSWTGASHDVVAVAWAPNSLHFAAGAAAHSNDEDLDYNRPCNLLYGDLQCNNLYELPDHRIDRKLPSEVSTGPSTNPAVYDACDPKVYMTVTAVKFSPLTSHMYSASEDHTIKVWDVNKRDCLNTIRHDAKVTTLDVSSHLQGRVAAGCKTLGKAIHIYNITDSGTVESNLSLSSSRAESRQNWTMYPECLQWGQSPNTQNFLLGGFIQWAHEESGIREGHLCLWDATTGTSLKLAPASQAVHAASWHPTLSYFAAGASPGLKVTDRHKTRTVVRVWDIRCLTGYAMEYECPASEITDVTFHPLDRNIVTAGCTDRKSYVWDFRWPTKPIHILEHGKSIMPRGERDTGVMMSAWGIGSIIYYTGSSDGAIYGWDIRRHPVDVLVQQVAHVGAGIQSGTFSPDGSHLLVGDAIGGIHVLSSAPWDPRPELEDEPAGKGTAMNIVRASRDFRGSEPTTLDNPGTDGIDSARALLAAGSLAFHPDFGVGKGPSYTGPFAKSERKSDGADGPLPGIGRMRKDVYRSQAFSRKGEIREANAKPIRDLVRARRELLDSLHQHTSGQAISLHTSADPIIDGALLNDQSIKLISKPRESERDSIDPHLQPSSSSSRDDVESEAESEDGSTWWPHMGEEEISRARENPRQIIFDYESPTNFVPRRP